MLLGNGLNGCCTRGTRRAGNAAASLRVLRVPGLHYRDVILIIYPSQTRLQAGPRRCWRFRGRRGRRRRRRLQAGLVRDEKSDDVRVLPTLCFCHRRVAFFVLAVNISTISQQKPNGFYVPFV